MKILTHTDAILPWDAAVVGRVVSTHPVLVAVVLVAIGLATVNPDLAEVTKIHLAPKEEGVHLHSMGWVIALVMAHPQLIQWTNRYSSGALQVPRGIKANPVGDSVQTVERMLIPHMVVQDVILMVAMVVVEIRISTETKNRGRMSKITNKVVAPILATEGLRRH